MSFHLWSELIRLNFSRWAKNEKNHRNCKTPINNQSHHSKFLCKASKHFCCPWHTMAAIFSRTVTPLLCNTLSVVLGGSGKFSICFSMTLHVKRGKTGGLHSSTTECTLICSPCTHLRCWYHSLTCMCCYCTAGRH